MLESSDIGVGSESASEALDFALQPFLTQDACERVVVPCEKGGKLV